ncbi:MAG: tRNA (adenosine(37)-N6)-dimethylallyltransferase MiaA [Clostridiales bacterium]|nr:tRNA (adenosine(37)-N6)-dimethylallyltransferase MiaA [Clostridiales bacterium]
MVQAHRIKALALVGCTAVGKSDTAIKLAKRFGGEIIGADSMQIYRGFDIGTGKLTAEECDGVVHKMIDIADGDADFSVGEYVKIATMEIERTHNSGKLPMIVGGTGLYVYSLLSGCNFADAPKDENTRLKLKLIAHFFGSKALHYMLQSIDSQSAAKISANDCKRVVRALEIYILRGRTKTDTVAHEKPYDDLTIVLTLPRDILYERINRRVHRMFDDGLIDEVKSLLKYKNNTSMQALGYKQIAADIDAPREQLEQITAQKTRNYAKRQMTYFNNMKLNKVFIDARDYDTITETVEKFLENKTCTG